MQRECGYLRPEDGAPCVMGAMHVTKHYYAEPKGDEVARVRSREVLPAVPLEDEPALNDGDLAKLAR
ncbi:MAG: hypothetical protein NVSMB32_13910 [Actinomycetota bacterium]